MQNKGFVIVLTIIITALCLFYLSFTMVSRRVQQDALAYATNEKGVFDFNKKQAYIDSVWNKPVYHFLGLEYTYKEVKENELSLGLDLQGGMHVTLEVSPVELIKNLAGNSQDPAFLAALDAAREKQKSSQERFTTLFFEAYKEANPDKSLASIFANATTRERISINDSDDKIKEVIDEEVESAIDRSYTILRSRIDQFGTSSPNIQRLPGTGRIQIEIPGADNPQRIRKLLQGVARLEFWDVVESNTMNAALTNINGVLAQEQKTLNSGKGKASDEGSVEDLAASLESTTPQDSTLTDSTASALEKQLSNSTDSAARNLDSLQNANTSPLISLSSPPGAYRYDLKDTATVNAILKRPEIKNMLPRNVAVYWGHKPTKFRNDDLTEDPKLQLYFLNIGRTGKPRLTGEVISNARQGLDPDGAGYAIHMTMNATGTRTWAKWTAEAANASPQGRIAIVLDNLVYSAPTVTGEIPNGNSQITGDFTQEEAKDLANILKAGSLPAPTKIVEEAIVGPTLGAVAAQEGIVSIVCGLILVVIFMVAYYSKGGLVANLALLFNIFFILGILAQPSLGTALTLPGIAGIVLTMGMAVDANVLIYERIKEERAHGRKLKDAISTGYKRAFATILDSNLTTFITGLFLFLFGQGPIKGFATTLMIGIATSFFSAIYISRIFIEWMTRRGEESKISFETGISKVVKKRKHFEFVRNSRMAYGISGVVILIGLAIIAFKGLNLGVDFKGGYSYVVTFSQPVSATDLKIDLTKSFENQGTEVKNYGSNNVMKVTTSYLIDEDSDTADETVRQALISGIESKFPDLKYTPNEAQVDDQHFTISSSTKVGATVADDIQDSAWEASLFSLIGIFIYILIRFSKWQYSAGAIVATIHDALFVFAAFAIASVLGISFEIDQVFVAAILTIIGYSINDTVIIFDRIREYIGIGTSHDRVKIFNDAINDTLSRTFITAGTTLLVVLVLLIFGGEVLRGFSFALFIGVIVGTYSSIFIASPIVLDLDKNKEKQPAETKKHAPAV